MHRTDNLKWRIFFIVTLLGLATLGGMAGTSAAAESALEKANMKVVSDFIASWDDPDKAVTFLSADASVRMVEDEPAVVGPAAIAAAFKGFLTPGVTLTVETLSTTAHGPVVLNKRIDTVMTPEGPDQVFPVAGVFIVKEGKIKEWADYLDK
ncbi:MAG: hypothetical protein GY910_05800 [bacterium]|nr:hypothetical protein [bacterium]